MDLFGKKLFCIFLPPGGDQSQLEGGNSVLENALLASKNMPWMLVRRRRA